MKYVSLFTGAAGLEMGVHELWPEADFLAIYENDPAATRLLDYHFPTVPNRGDASVLDWSGLEDVDMIIGGYPCQPYSIAGKKQGDEDERDGWPWFFDAIRVLRPRFILAENVSGHVGLGFTRTIADLASIGFDAEWGTFRASDIGAPHSRERLFLLAWDTSGIGVEGLRPQGIEHAEEVAGPAILDGGVAGTLHVDDRWNEYRAAIQRWSEIVGRSAPEPLLDIRKPSVEFLEWFMGWPEGWTDVPEISWKDRVKLVGNGIVPKQAAAAYRLLFDRALER